MAFWTGWADKVGAAWQGVMTGITGISLSKSDGSADLWQSNDSGAAKVAVDSSALPTGAATAAKQGPYTPVASAALEASHVVSTAACSLHACAGRLDSTAPTATYYVHCTATNAGAIPNEGTVTHLLSPVKIQHVLGVDDYWDFGVPAGGVTASAGVAVYLSSTEFTKTISGAYLSLDGVVL